MKAKRSISILLDHKTRMGRFLFIIMGLLLCDAASAMSPSQRAAILAGAACPASTKVAGVCVPYSYNFQTNVAYVTGVGTPTAASQLSITRASVGTAVDTSGTWAQFGNGAARITNQGLLVEESRINSIRNNSMQGAIVGTPGTQPTNWTYPNLVGLSSQIVATGIIQGIDYVDIRLFGTTSGAGSIQIGFEANNNIAAAQNQTWDLSAFIAVIAGSTTNLTSVNLTIDEFSAVPTFLANNLIVISPTSTLTRFSGAKTLGNVLTAFIRPAIVATVTGAVAVDCTFRIGWPQVEQGTSLTSPIRTTNVAVTRAADGVKITTSPSFGSSYTLFARGIPNAQNNYGTNQSILQADDGSNNNRSFGRRLLTTAALQIGNVTGGVETDYSPTGTWAQNTVGKLAWATAAGDQAASFNGGAIATGSASIPVGVNEIYIGSNRNVSVWFNGYIQRIAFDPNVRRTNEFLQSATQ